MPDRTNQPSATEGRGLRYSFVVIASMALAASALDGKPLGELELEKARELYTSRGCVACHQHTHLTKAPTLIAVSEKYAANDEGLKLISASLVSGSIGKWGKVVEMPPQGHLQEAERDLLARWVLGLHASGEKPPGSSGALEGFAKTTGFNIAQWSQYEYFGPRLVTVGWNKETEDLSLKKADGAAVAGLYRTGFGRAPSDRVTLTVKGVEAAGKPWGQVGLMISTVPQPQLFDSHARYEWVLRRETNGPGWVYRVRKDVGSGSYELYSSELIDPAAPVKLDIVRTGDNYEFIANGVLHYTTGANPSDTYDVEARDAMIYFGVTFGGSSAMSATVDNFSVGIPVPGAVGDAPTVLPAGDDLFIEQRNGAIIKVLDQPVVYRTYLPDAPSRAIAVGLPSDVSFGFDAQNCRLLYAWRGGFLDVTKSWKGFGGWYSKLLGERFHVAPPGFPLRVGDPQKEPKVQFKGYDLVDGYPVFKYLVDGSSVRHWISIREVGERELAVLHRFRLPGNTKPVYFLAGTGAGTTHHSGDAEWTDGSWKVRAEKLTQFSISTGVPR
jgi:cytochrome c551/c552